MTISKNADRMQPTATAQNNEPTPQKSVKGIIKVPTKASSMKKLRERARIRKEKDNKASNDIPSKNNTNDQPKKEKKKMDMDFFLGRK